jgi:diadenosine tetraphosphate (Ap4A) HIT family hydrolase
MDSGWAVMGDVQYPIAYALLLADPVVEHLNDLNEIERASFLGDMADLGAALREAAGADRVNYEIQGNTEAALHAHLFSRFSSEPAEYRRGPVWRYPPELRNAHPFVEAVHGKLRDSIASALAASRTDNT